MATPAQSTDLQELRRQCLLGARLLWRELRELYGHVSCRLPDGSGFLLAMVRVPPAPLDPDEVLRFDMEGNQLEGRQPPPYELPMHTEVYRRRPDVAAVVHSHPHVATALSTTGKTIFALTQQSRMFGTGIPTFQGDFITDRALGEALAEQLGTHVAILLKGHGALTVGRHVPEAVGHMLYLEQAAKQLLWASIVGTPEPLPQRLREHRFPEERGMGGGALNLWRQLLWDWERGGEPKEPGALAL
jgi:ribulose-5-phosphate 4-epimerase/fuculose-1-phosphate aldolase